LIPATWAASVVFTATTALPAANIEPIAALVMGWIVLNQTLKPSQIVGALIVMGGIVLLAMQTKL
jgi:drug/metabolite transporter (DMT)-like permease